MCQHCSPKQADLNTDQNPKQLKMSTEDIELYLDQQPLNDDNNDKAKTNKMVDDNGIVNDDKERGEENKNDGVNEEERKRLSWEEFYSSTTVHGFHFIFDQTGIRRLGWLIIFLGAFFLAGKCDVSPQEKRVTSQNS